MTVRADLALNASFDLGPPSQSRERYLLLRLLGWKRRAPVAEPEFDAPWCNVPRPSSPKPGSVELLSVLRRLVDSASIASCGQRRIICSNRSDHELKSSDADLSTRSASPEEMS